MKTLRGNLHAIIPWHAVCPLSIITYIGSDELTTSETGHIMDNTLMVMSIINRYAIICMIQKVLTNRIEWNPWCASWTDTWLIFFKSALTRAFAWKVWARETKWRYVRTHIMGTIRNLHFSTFFVITGRRVLWTLHISHLSLSVTRVKFDVCLGVCWIFSVREERGREDIFAKLLFRQSYCYIPQIQNLFLFLHKGADF